MAAVAVLRMKGIGSKMRPKTWRSPRFWMVSVPETRVSGGQTRGERDLLSAKVAQSRW